VVLLGLFAAGSAAVGEYGAAYRLIEATLFITTAFNAATLPWFSRRDADAIAHGFELAIKTVLALMLPVGLGLALFAEPVIETLYGPEYDGAVTPLRILGVMTALWGVNATIVTILVSRDRPDVYTVPALVALVPNLVLSAILIPADGANGAAIAAVAAAALLVVLVVPRTARLFGPMAWGRMVAAPVAAGAAMAAAATALSFVPWVPAALLSGAVYAAAFLAVERLFSPRDFAFYVSALPGSRSRAGRTTA
jgi:O-antigen/teichoic acid export membrane protein